MPREKGRHSTRRRACSRRCGSRSTTNSGSLDRLLAQLPRVVKPGGRVGIISFHSLEDRRVKQAFQDRDGLGAGDEEAGQAGEDEVRDNPRSRSAKLRVARRPTCPRQPRRDEGRDREGVRPV